jgi:hypothetical protein
MAAVEVEVSLCSQYTEGNASGCSENRCQNYVRMIEYVNVLTTKLKSAQIRNRHSHVRKCAAELRQTLFVGMK